MAIPFIKSAGYIETKNKAHSPNGWLHLLVNEHDFGELPIEQVYLTSCSPGEVKGPHMHGGSKCDRFYCVSGSATLVCRDESTGELYEFCMKEFDRQVVHVPANTSHGIVSKDGAVLVSMTTEGFRKDKAYNQIETIYEGYDWQQWL